ncbi:unnamed protein product [Paramecium pentaurelia]|uniref:PSI domain-containing protein n=1 Tax=Paramecium pentaurelia TaxID=43138 RepID=A0A8S1TFH4_9CILI|nr:unnamed protein product [Paramecium pentaurelia]
MHTVPITAQLNGRIAYIQNRSVIKLLNVSKQLNRNNVTNFHMPAYGKWIQTEQDCKYTFPSLYMNVAQICVWQNGKCKDLNESNNLDSEQCLQNTLDTYKWTGSSCVSCFEVNWQLQFSLQLPNQCNCSQLQAEYTCLQKSSCIWSNSYCQSIECSSIMRQFQCASNPYCVWLKGQCQMFKSCTELKGTNQSDCIVLSINCPASDGINCLDSKLLLPCSAYKSQSSCTNMLGRDGFCIWQYSTCQVLRNCQQINKQQDCQYFTKQCYWSTSCQPVSCSIFNTPNTCQYYYQSINSYTPVSCYWVFGQGICAQTTDFMKQLTPATCQTNTNLTATWSNTLKICLSCLIPSPPNPKQCSCSQLISQQNCLQSQQCFWNIEINQCLQLPCDKLNQQQCIQNSKCWWKFTMQACEQLTSCSDLYAGSDFECISQSLFCPLQNKDDPPYFKCESYSQINFTNCEDLNQTQCNQYVMPPYYICQWNNYLGKCQYQSYCNQLGNPKLCYSNPFCYYQDGCKSKTCEQFNTLESCKFSINPNNWNYIQSCAWLNGSCISADNLFSEQNCYINSDYTARWSTNVKDGFCIPCNISFQQSITPKNQCLCSQLLTQYECNLSSCYWQNGFCIDNNYDCNQSNQIDCIQKAYCYWIYQKELPYGGYCNNIPQLQIQQFCTRLKGSNSLECLSQTTLCPVSIDGICQDRTYLQTCQSKNSIQLCANSIGQEGYCTYQNQSCQILTNCTQLKTISECFLFDKICVWNASSGSCSQLFCSSYTTQDSCTYIFQNINKSNIQICVWNTTTNLCTTATYIIEKSFQDCYQTSGGTYHWSNTLETIGTCVSCSLNKIQPKHTCSCTELNKFECEISKPVCKLNESNQCVKLQCSEILDSVYCSQQNECMWNLNQCVVFTKCTDLKGSSTLDCIAQSIECQYIQNGICQSTQSLHSCDKYETQECTFGIQGSDGLCYWNSLINLCSVISSCDDITNQLVCSSLTPACQWSYFFQSCVPFQCQDHNYKDQCTNVLVNLNDPQIELCVWQNNKCVPYVDSFYKLDDDICYTNSDHTYRWVKEDKHGTRCKQCLKSSLINIIAIIIILNIL